MAADTSCPSAVQKEEQSKSKLSQAKAKVHNLFVVFESGLLTGLPRNLGQPTELS
jgi:hypothetical protein